MGLTGSHALLSGPTAMHARTVGTYRHTCPTLGELTAYQAQQLGHTGSHAQLSGPTALHAHTDGTYSMTCPTHGGLTAYQAHSWVLQVRMPCSQVQQCIPILSGLTAIRAHTLGHLQQRPTLTSSHALSSGLTAMHAQTVGTYSHTCPTPWGTYSTPCLTVGLPRTHPLLSGITASHANTVRTYSQTCPTPWDIPCPTFGSYRLACPTVQQPCMPKLLGLTA